MELKKNFEIIYICKGIRRPKGARYNSHPNPAQDWPVKEVGHVYTRETVAGFFRMLKLNELHFRILNIVNSFQILGKEELYQCSMFSETKFSEILEDCMKYGLICENIIPFLDGSEIRFYLVDTGGIFVLEEVGTPYNKLEYTTSIDGRINIFRKNQFLAADSNFKASKVYFLEQIIGNPVEKYQNAVLIYESEIAEKIDIKDAIAKELEKYQNHLNIKIYDLTKKSFV